MKILTTRHLLLLLLSLTMTLPGSAQKTTDNTDMVKNIIDRYDMRDDYGIFVTSEEGLAALYSRLVNMPAHNVGMTLSELERRHLNNENVLNFAKTIKGKEMSDKYIKNLTAKIGEERVGKAVEVINRAKAEEAMYPKVKATLETLQADIEKTLAEKPFPEGKLLRLYYRHGGGMRSGRYEFNITRDKQGQYELKTIRPGTPYDMTYLDDAMATYDVDEAFIERIVEVMKKDAVQTRPKDNTFFPGRLFDAPRYSLRAVFEKGEIETSGDGTLPVAEKWQKIVEEESK